MAEASPALSGQDGFPAETDFSRDVISGLRKSPPSIPPKYFYDTEGSRLFEAICEQPEYYLTRTEIELLECYVGEISGLVGSGCYLIEPGSGNCEKVRLLVDSLRPRSYIPIDISSEHLKLSAARLADSYPWLDIQPMTGDITDTLVLPCIPENARRVVFYPGSSIGNFEPEEARSFLGSLARIAGRGGALVIGVDLQKNTQRLNAAYNDACGITAAFNRNLLQRINRELDANLDIEAFDHRAFYNQNENRMEMHLVSNCRQSFHVDGHRFELEDGDHIHTENSYKYTIEQFQTLATAAGFAACRVWSDAEALFSLHYLEVR
ncbi:MAG: L-histidine N(alpha)-methyltransferase [Gammaproteobacteria bacterium]|nr:MAG: L-histidine N(alpha)-methyltransferase [Gammaproteobacteria bacterium]